MALNLIRMGACEPPRDRALFWSSTSGLYLQNVISESDIYEIFFFPLNTEKYKKRTEKQPVNPPAKPVLSLTKKAQARGQHIQSTKRNELKSKSSFLALFVTILFMVFSVLSTLLHKLQIETEIRNFF